MNLFFYLIFRVLAGVFVLFPFWVLYFFSDLLYVAAFYGFRYRKKVVFSNLKRVFPEESNAEIQYLSRLFYRYFTDVMVESLKGLTMSKKNIVKRYSILNPELLDKYYEQHISMIGVSGHYGNWEWGSIAGGLQIKHHPVAFYKPISNGYIDKFVRKSRQRCGTQLASIQKTFDTFVTNKDKTCVFLMIADQSPSTIHLDKAYWLEFLGIDTAFLYGPEKYAKMYNLPVFYIDIRPVKRGYYELELILLTDSPNKLNDGELTMMFVKMLEKRIKDKPQYWMWSHRRWKRTRQKTAA